MSAIDLLEKAAGHLKDRAETYDKPDGERSIGATVAAFNAVTGDGLMNSEERGWLFMAILKMVRSQQGNYRADNYEDLAAYGALMGEAACDERNGGWTPEAIKSAAFKSVVENVDEFNKANKIDAMHAQIKETCKAVPWPDESRIDVTGQNGNDGAVYSEYTLAEVVGDAVLSDWAKWVSVDKSGEVWEYSEKPSVNYIQTEWIIHTGYFTHITNVVPPLNFKNCIWGITK